MKKIVILIGLLLPLTLTAQDRFDQIRSNLETYAQTYPGLQEDVELSVNNTDVKEFIRAIGNVNGLNVSVSEEVAGRVVNNFSNAKVLDVFVFLCMEYNLDLEMVGSIISIYPYKQEPVKPKPKPVVPPSVYFNDSTGFLSLDLKKDTLNDVAEEITKITGVNIILEPGLEESLVSVFIMNRPLQTALENFAFANNLDAVKKEERIYLLTKKKKEPVNQANNTTRGRGANPKQLEVSEEVEITSNEGRISVKALNQPISDLINWVSDELMISYFLFTEPKESATVTIENATYDQFLTYLLNGSKYTYKKEGRVYLIGEKNLEKLRSTEMIQLQNRTIEALAEVIPAETKKGLEIKEFPELNSFVVTGSVSSIYEFKNFINQVDKVVPVVLIEIIIADIAKNKTLATGIDVGLGEVAQTTEGNLFPTVDLNFNTSTINDLIDNINGFGVINLGKVTPQFYLSLKAMEENGILKTRSTPKLSTINGHEASLSIGTQEYYLEVSNNVIGTQNPSFVTTQNYRSVQADLSVNIKPIVSGNEQVTLEIEVSQSDFTARISPDAPPGTVSRNFKSLIRIKNNEMILLGGLEEKSVNDAGSGVPFLSRIPILKWLFSSRTSQSGKSKLTIFIKPTVLY